MIGRQQFVQMLGQRVQRLVGLHQLAEGDLDRERFFQMQRGLGQRERIETEFEQGGVGVGVLEFDAGDFFEKLAQARLQRGAAIVLSLRGGHRGLRWCGESGGGGSCRRRRRDRRLGNGRDGQEQAGGKGAELGDGGFHRV